MKWMLAFFLALLAAPLLAQPVVMSRIRADSLFTSKNNLSQYATRTEVAMETPFSMQFAVRNAILTALDTRELAGITIWVTLYLNEKGKIDYAFFDFGPTFSQQEKQGVSGDSLSGILEKRLPAALSGIVSRRNHGTKSILRTTTESNAFKTAVPKDSMVVGLEEARSVRDTLRVKRLRLSRGLLAEVPDVIYRFPNMEVLLLDDNDLESIALDTRRLPRLQSVDLSRNMLQPDRITITANKSIRSLNLQKNGLADIPRATQHCRNLQSLLLGGNSLTALSGRSFRRLGNVTDLNLYKAGIAALPKRIGRLKSLRVLDLYYNQLEKLPKNIVKLKKLTHLAISHNKLAELPEKIGKLSNVHTLYAHHNRLSRLPQGIVQMQNLRTLDLGYNLFTDFPTELTAFDKLGELDLSANNFIKFPEELLKMKKVGKLYLRGNPFLKGDYEEKYSAQLGQLKKRQIEVFY